MPVRRLHGSWWVDIRHNFVRHRKKSPDNTKMGAQAYEVTLRAALARGEDIDAPAPQKEKEPTFAEFAWRWFETYVRSKCKPSGIATKGYILRLHLLPFFGKLPLRRVTAMAVQEFKNGQSAKGVHPKTVNDHLTVLRTCLKSACEADLLTKVPAIELNKLAPPPFRTLDKDEQRRLLQAAAAEPEWGPVVLLALRTGMRMGELFGLNWEDIDWEQGTVTVRRCLVKGVLGSPKNDRIRTLPLARDAADALVHMRRESGIAFPRPDGRHRCDSVASYALIRLCRRAGIKPHGWHVLRHTFATDLALANTPPFVMMKLLGHASIEMTMRYTHPDMNAMRAAVAALGQGYAGPKASARGQPVGNNEQHSEPRPHVPPEKSGSTTRENRPWAGASPGGREENRTLG